MRDLTVPRPFAYSIISDYPRWPEWSPWLHRVSIGQLDDGTKTSHWFLRFKAISVDWQSKNVEEVPGSFVRWESTGGLPNGGTLQVLSGKDAASSTLTISLRYQIPLVVSTVFRPAWVEAFVSRRLTADLQRFRTIAEREHAESL